MYWTVWGDSPALERAQLDGTSRKVLITKMGRAQDLTIDYLERRLYWTNEDGHSIKSSDMLGEWDFPSLLVHHEKDYVCCGHLQ